MKQSRFFRLRVAPLLRLRKHRPLARLAIMLPLLIPVYLFILLVLPAHRSGPGFPPAAVVAAAATQAAIAVNAATSTTMTATAATATATRIPKSPLLNIDFPDPCVVRDPGSGTWYAFATGGWTPPDTRKNETTNQTEILAPTYVNIQAAVAPSPQGVWTHLPSMDALPQPGGWTAGPGSRMLPPPPLC